MLEPVSTKAIEEISLAAGILGALILAAGSLLMILASRSYTGPGDADHRREKWMHLLGGLLIAVGFAGSLWRLVQR
jgi:hypothetical protein